MGEGIIFMLETAYNIYNLMIIKALGLFTKNPIEMNDGAVWDVVTQVAPIFVAIAAVMFIVGFCSESIDVKQDIRLESVMRLLIRLSITEYLIANSLTITKAIIKSMTALAGLMVTTGSTKNLVITLPDTAKAIIRDGSFLENIVPLIIATIGFLVIIVCGVVVVYMGWTRLIKVVLIAPFGAVAFATIASGNHSTSNVLPSFIKYVISTSLEAVTMILAIKMTNAIGSSGIIDGIVLQDESGIALIIRTVLQAVLVCVLCCGLVKGAQTLTNKALGL